MSDYTCPWCGYGIDEPDYWEIEPDVDQETECPNCERELTFSYYLAPVFSVQIPEVLNECREGCEMWDGIEECCGHHGDRERKRNEINRILGKPAAEPMAGCPLGYELEESDER